LWTKNSVCFHWAPCFVSTQTAAIQFDTLSGLGTLPVGEIFQMNPSRQFSPYSMPTPDVPMHQRSTLIELLVIISIIGVLICDKQ
jgi:hypothetical protein